MTDDVMRKGLSRINQALRNHAIAQQANENENDDPDTDEMQVEGTVYETAQLLNDLSFQMDKQIDLGQEHMQPVAVQEDPAIVHLDRIATALEAIAKSLQDGVKGI